MKIFQKLYLLTALVAILGTSLANAQVQLTPVLVSSAGSFSTWTGGSLSASVGEPAIATLSSSANFLTQGFQQPRLVQELTIEVSTIKTTCTNSKDGSATAVLIGGVPPYTYLWSPGAETTDSIFGLSEGEYSVTITDFYNRSATDTFTIVTEFEGDCEFKFYSGITPNGDGVNDFWMIDGIEFYPDNTVLIFNRWGDKVWEGTGYDNVNVVWTGIGIGGIRLPDATYFYVATLKDNVHKGWVELTR